MAYRLAIEQSDVDLTVIGLNLQGLKEKQLQEMNLICDQLKLFMKSISSLQFIDQATVPVIKLQIDLQKVSNNIVRKEKMQSVHHFEI